MGDEKRVTYAELYRMVSQARAALERAGVVEGDRIVAFIPNCVEAIVMMLAASSFGAIWSSCSPDFGVTVCRNFGAYRILYLLSCTPHSLIFH